MGRLLTLVAMRNLFQSSLLATLLVFLNSTLLRSTGYPEITHTHSINDQQCVTSLTALVCSTGYPESTHTHTQHQQSTVCHVTHSCCCAAQGTMKVHTHTHTHSINSLSRPSQLWRCSKSCRSRWWMYTCHNGNRSVHLAVAFASAYTEGTQFRWMTLHQLTMCTSVCHFSFCHNDQHLAFNCGGWGWVVWGQLTMYSCVGSSDNV